MEIASSYSKRLAVVWRPTDKQRQKNRERLILANPRGELFGKQVQTGTREMDGSRRKCAFTDLVQEKSDWIGNRGLV